MAKTTKRPNKKALVFFCGLSSGISYMLVDELRKRMPNTATFEKNLLSDTLLNGLDHTTPQYHAIKDRIYRTLTLLALDNLRNENTVAILQAYYGDKLTNPGIVEAITSENYEVKIVYLHCSGKKQLQSLEDRAKSRDHDKLGLDKDGQPKFPSYRLEHIKNHLRELAQVSHFLMLDTENDENLDANVSKLIEYIHTPTPRIQITPIANQAALDAITVEEAFGNCALFRELLDRVQPGHSRFITHNLTTKTANSACLQSFTPAFGLTRKQAAYGTLGLVALGLGVTAVSLYARSEPRGPRPSI